jgi:hypothetical protein
MRTRFAVVSALATMGFLFFVVMASASCPSERTSHCQPFAFKARGHTYHSSRVAFALNGHPRCGHATSLIKAWLMHGGSRIRDPSSGVAWSLVSRNPFEFVAGLCGDLRFRL